jgi:hypothetical protein
MDCRTKKSLTASYLGVSASFFHPSGHQPVHVLLNLYQIAHPHTAVMLGSQFLETLASLDISRSKVLLVVTDNSSNIIKTVKVAHATESISATDIKEQEKEVSGEGKVDDGDTKGAGG